MVTEAVNNILGLNPMGAYFSETEYDSGGVWTGNLLPICPNMIGGILLFSKALDNGYKFVWEFTPSQGNGTIAAVAMDFEGNLMYSITFKNSSVWIKKVELVMKKKNRVIHK